MLPERVHNLCCISHRTRQPCAKSACIFQGYDTNYSVSLRKMPTRERNYNQLSVATRRAPQEKEALQTQCRNPSNPTRVHVKGTTPRCTRSVPAVAITTDKTIKGSKLKYLHHLRHMRPRTLCTLLPQVPHAPYLLKERCASCPSCCSYNK